MPKYLVKARYDAAGLHGLLDKGGSSRRSVVEELTKSCGGTLEALYYAFGEDDLYAIAELPDNQAAARLALTVGATGRVAITTVPLISVEELDAVATGGPAVYTPPGV